MIRVGLTGTVGAGKSTVGALFETWGGFRIDADRLARRAVLPGTSAWRAIRQAFGGEVFLADGTLDRPALRRIVFADPEARERLETIVHPAVDVLRRQAMERAGRQGVSVAVLEIPLLFEKGLESEADVTVVVDAPEPLRRRRICAERGLSEADFEAINAAQWSGERKRALADHVIWNDGDRSALQRAARAVWDSVSDAG